MTPETATSAESPPAADGADPVGRADEPARRRRRDAGPAAADAPEATSRRAKRRRRLRARRVDRIIRRIDPWSVLKVSFFFLLSLWVVVLLAGVILWTAASGSGAIDNVEEFVTELFGLESFAFEGEQLFRGTAVGGLIMVLAGTAFSVLLAVLFNLISDLTGGIQVAVVELENLRRNPDATPGRDGGRPPASGSGRRAARRARPPA